MRNVFHKLYQSIGVPVWGFVTREPDMLRIQWATHAVQAGLWQVTGDYKISLMPSRNTANTWLTVSAGVNALARMYEDIVMSFTEPSDDECRISVICSRAKHVSHYSVR